MSELSKIVKRIEKDLPGWAWLLRNDAARGAFANIHCVGSGTESDYIEGQTSFPFYASTPEGALEAAYLGARCHTLREAFEAAKKMLEAE